MEYRVAEKLTALNLVNILPALYESRRFITVFTKAHNYPSSQPAQSSPRHHVSYFIIIFTLSLGLRGGRFRRGWPIKILYASCSLPYTPHVSLISFILCLQQYLVRSTNRKSSHYTSVYLRMLRCSDVLTDVTVQWRLNRCYGAVTS
jgi:hypothetical protein